MERHANYALVGIVSTVFLIASIVFVVWLGGSQFRRGHDLYRIMFVGPVRGLSKGGEVQFNGIKVGQIQNIRLDEDDPNRVLTDIAVDRGTPIRVDSMASTEIQGISSVSVIQISAGSCKSHCCARSMAASARSFPARLTLCLLSCRAAARWSRLLPKRSTA